jgi:hypothetical protein
MTVDPEPGTDLTRSHQWRFRDPQFVLVWQRWCHARNEWRRAWWNMRISEGGADSIYDPNPALITDASVREAAIEFTTARAIYLADLARRDQP